MKYDRLILKGLLVHVNTKVDLHVKFAQFPYSGRPRWIDDGQFICELDFIIGNWGIGDIRNNRKNGKKTKA